MSETTIEIAVKRLRTWVVNDALPLWSTKGVDASRGTFIERLSFEGEALADVPRRTMVQARQIYVFAHAALLGFYPSGRDLALDAARHLIRDCYAADGKPGWVFSIHADGRVCSDRRDFYAHAFVMFGLAWAFKLAPEKKFLDATLATLDILDRQFAAPAGGYFTALPPDIDRLDQNPHMHLFEAMLAWYEASKEPMFLARAGELYSMMVTRFFQPGSGILPEYFSGGWLPVEGDTGRICEPGHHYEWSWLLRNYAAISNRSRETIAYKLKDFADRCGYDAEGLIVDELFDDGSVRKASRRCWPLTEALKAEVAAFELGDDKAASRAADIIDRLCDVFLARPVAGGWTDHIDENGKPLVDFMPASTLYHVFLAMTEANRLWGRP